MHYTSDFNMSKWFLRDPLQDNFSTKKIEKENFLLFYHVHLHNNSVLKSWKLKLLKTCFEVQLLKTIPFSS